MNTAPTPVIVQSGAGKELRAFGDHPLSVLFAGEQPGGTLAVMLAGEAPGGGPPFHVRSREDEWLLVVEGRISYYADGRWTEVGPGGAVYLPRGCPHTYRNVGTTPSKHWLLTAPSGFEEFFAVAPRSSPGRAGRIWRASSSSTTTTESSCSANCLNKEIIMNDRLGQPVTTQVATFGGIVYVQHDGIFEGQTSTGTFRVPYRITAPAQPQRANRTVVVEPSHFAAELTTLNVRLRRDFLFPRKFVHAGIGWSMASIGPNGGFRILDPAAPGVFINGGQILIGYDGLPENGPTDDEIIVNFASALAVDGHARRMIGRVERRYLTGASDSSMPVIRLITSGQAAGVFDFALPVTPDPYDLQAAIAAGQFGGKIIVLNSEFEGPSDLLQDKGMFPNQYRFYAVAGTPHIPDFLAPGPMTPGQTTPASWQPALRAHFLQGDKWVRTGDAPPPSNKLKTSGGGTLDRDAYGNAISVDAGGRLVPRLPCVELHEAQFIVPRTAPLVPLPAGFPPSLLFLLGDYDAVKTRGALGFPSHRKYLQEFKHRADACVRAGYMLAEDAVAMRDRAALCPDLTFTGVYHDQYDKFAAIVSCGP